MSFNKKLLASAIVGLLISANAGAVELGVDDARLYAAELVDGTLLTDAGDTATFDVGYNFSPGEVRYGRYECTSNMTMDNVVVTEGSADLTLGAINGQGTSGVFFSMTASDPLGGPTEGIVISVDADNTLEDGGSVNCAFSIYDQPSQAQAGGTTGRIYTTGFQPFIDRADSFVFIGTPGNAVADVEAPAGAYTGFVTNGVFGALEFGLAPVVPFNADGTPITMDDLFSPDTTVTIDGDFSAAADLTWNGVSADDIDDDASLFEFTAPVLGNDGPLQFFEDGTTAIPESDYTASLDADANAGFMIDDINGVDVGMISRNGTQLQAPLAQVPGAGWLSRMVLTNTGSLDRPYEITVMGEEGNVISTANTTGTVPANGTIVVDLTTVLTGFSSNFERATLNVTVAGPNNQIQGLYQIVNANAGSLSNHVMVRPGTN